MRSQALLGQLRYSEAGEAAAAAAQVLNRQGRRGWAVRAEVLSIQGSQAITRDAAEHCLELARELASSGQWLDAAEACAVVARSDPAAALAVLQAIPLPQRDIPLDYRLATLERDRPRPRRDPRSSRRVAVHERRHRAGQPATCDARLRRSSCGGERCSSTRLPSSVSGCGAMGVDRGLCSAGSIGAVAVLRRSHLRRSTGMPNAASCSPSSAPVQQQARAADAEQMPALMRDQARLQRRLIAADRSAGGRAGRESRPPRDLRARLGRVVVVQHHRHGERLGAVVVEDGRARTVDLGQLDAIERHAELLSRATRRVARTSPSVSPTSDRWASWTRTPWRYRSCCCPRLTRSERATGTGNASRSS